MTLHLTNADDPPRVDPLAQSLRDKSCASGTARFFAEMWRERDCCGRLEDAAVKSGLAERYPATEADAERHADDMVEVGEPMWRLTDAGRAAIEAAKRAG